MVTREYVPDAGDLIWINFSPQVGHEQAGKRPAVVLSPRSYNGMAGMAVMCPLTTQVKGYPFEVPVPKGNRIHGVIMADQVKSLDWRGRGAQRAGRIPSAILADVLRRIAALLQIP